MANPFRRNRKNDAVRRHVGEIRKSQLISTFGVGSIVDFVKETAVIGGIDDWDQYDGWETRQLTNENLQAFMGVRYFLEPKTSDGQRFAQSSQDVVSYIFPEKLYCPICKSIIDYRELANQKNKKRCNQRGKDGKECKGNLVASRFVLICENGHMEDFPYSWWAHRGASCVSGKPAPRIKMYNIDGRSDTESLLVECMDCGKKRSMVGIFNQTALAGENGRCCSGRHPHLGIWHSECSKTPIVKIRTSTGIYFPITYSALLIPPWSQKAMNLIEKKFDELLFMEKKMGENGVREYLCANILPKCSNLSFDDLACAYKTLKKRRETKAARSESDIYVDEYCVLCRDNMDEDRYSSHFVPIPSEFTEYFDIVSVVDRLVVTQALCGFTRYRPFDGKDSSCIVPLSVKKKEWLPAVELKGEGIFIRFKRRALEEWKNSVGNRYDEMARAHNDTFFTSPKYASEYVLLHSFAHLFIRQLAGECGYSAASLREKIYSTFTDGTNDAEMCGVLIYLSSSDSDGSLGGLISVAEDTELFDKVLKNMLREARWCSGDPLCAAAKHQGFASLNYAACHACILLPETSCEFRNVLLDRVSVVGLPDNQQLGIMGGLANLL